MSVSYEKIGDVLVVQGNLPEALKSFRDGHDIFDRLVQADPGKPAGSATCRRPTARSATCRMIREICRRR
jgi:hypothetical protein